MVVKAAVTLSGAAKTAGRVYDKGERRHKHEGRTSTPAIEYDGRNPKKFVGKCPHDISPQQRSTLLNEAVAGPIGDREITVAKVIYAVHEGAVCEAQTSDQGASYHGYPYRGPLAGRIVRALRSQATEKACVDAFEKWVKEHIEVKGSDR